MSLHPCLQVCYLLGNSAEMLIHSSKLLVNCVSKGKTPWFPPETLGQWGVKVCISFYRDSIVQLKLTCRQLAIYPGAAGKSVLHTIRRAYKYLKETGKDDAEAMGLDPRGFFDVMGLQREMEIDRLAGGVAFSQGA